MMKKFQIQAKIIKNARLKGGYFKMSFAALKIARQARPGEFVHIKVSPGDEPLLRRPFSIHRVSGQNIEVFYEILGEGTQILSQRKPGEYLDVIGPLGRGFGYEGRRTKDEGRILVAGGMGVAPLLFLAGKICGHKVTVLIGAKTKEQILCAEEFRKLGCEVKIATDDGSRGYQGKVTDLLGKILPLAISRKPLAIYACGPRLMLKEVASLSQRYNIAAEISLEEHMSCGIGACFGCVVKTNDEGRMTKNGFVYKHVCKDGPVFNAKEIIW